MDIRPRLPGRRRPGRRHRRVELAAPDPRRSL